ncbi:hypothetical protein BSR42_10365 [Megasphaera cerevisiae]|nr:hypothetical protein BSR42_10365 [Megasphaera cerevisiae]
MYSDAATPVQKVQAILAYRTAVVLQQCRTTAVLARKKQKERLRCRFFADFMCKSMAAYKYMV